MPHTPGDWELVDLAAPLDDWTGARYVIREPKHAPGGICVIIGGAGGLDDAHLLKVAPKLLELARGYKAFLLAMHDDAMGHAILERVDRLIADAEGRL